MERKLRFSFLLLAGILLLGAGLAGLLSVPDVMQYAFLPPSGKDVSMLEQYDEAMKTMAEAFPKLTLHGVRSGAGLKGGGKEQGGISLYSTGPSWNEVYPRRILKGRPIVRVDSELKSGVIVLDEETAFSFFGATEAIGRTVKLDGDRELEVVGIAAHSRRAGETGAYAAWVPLDLTANNDLMVLSAPSASVSLFAMFETQAQSCFGSGTAISLAKEKSRAMLPLLLVFVILAIWLLKRWIRWLAEYGKKQVEKVRAESKKRYALRLMPYAAGQLLPAAVLIALTAAACYGLAVLALNPMRIFPEWIPETLGEYTGWINKFWNLTEQAAKPVTMKTAELAEVQLWGSLILWGTLLILLRAARNSLTGFCGK